MTYTCTQDMLLTAAKATTCLDDDACQKISDFLLAQQNDDGGFAGRTRTSDLYYTLFAMAALFSLKKTLQPTILKKYLNSFESKNYLDFVHLASLVRCQASLPFLKEIPLFIKTAESPLAFFAKFAAKRKIKLDDSILNQLEAYRSADGSYHNSFTHHDTGSIYAAFLAHLAYQDSGRKMRDSHLLLEFVKKMKCSDGSYANERHVHSGATTTTAAALVLLDEFNETIPEESIECLLNRMSSDGGFLANNSAPSPDLLSTATALYALKRANYPLAALKPANLDFAASLWNENGGFSGNQFDDKSDCEYTFYALLSIGCLSY